MRAIIPTFLLAANQEDRSKMLGDVCLLQQRMQFRLKEYKTLVQMALGLFRNLSEVERTIEVVERKSHQHNTTYEVDQAIKDHQVTRNTIAEMIKITKQEADQFISLLRDQVERHSVVLLHTTCNES